MPQLRHISSGNIYIVSQVPVYTGGVWECGDQRFIDVGGTYEAVPQSPDVPLSVTMRQARLALSQAGLLASVDAAVASSDQATIITWEYSQDVRRDDQYVLNIGASLGLTNEQIDNLFIAASTL